MRLLGVLGLSLLVVAGLTEKSMADVNCEQLPDCAALGFSTEDDENCAENGYLYCPFDTSYKKCVTHSFYSCPDGYSADITSTSQCGSYAQGWKLDSTTVEANDGSQVTCNKCVAKTYADYGYVQYSSSCNEVWKSVYAYLGDQYKQAYECMSCTAGGAASRCIDGCKYICISDDRRPEGYPGGECYNNRGNYECCSYTSTPPSGVSSSDYYKC